MSMQAGLQFDPEQFNAAMAQVQGKLSGHISETCNIAVEIAKELSPVGWNVENVLPAKTRKPRGYRGGTNRKSITADFSTGTGEVKTIGGSSVGGMGMPKPWEINFRIYTQSGYGAWLELGTRHMRARPYIHTGFTQAVAKLLDQLRGAI